MGDDVEPTIDGKVLSELKVVELKEELGKMGLSKIGNKSVLYDRLKEQLLGVATVSDESEQESLVKTAVEGEESAPSNPFVAEYLARQQVALQAARKDAVMEGFTEVARRSVPKSGSEEQQSPPPSAERTKSLRKRNSSKRSESEHSSGTPEKRHTRRSARLDSTGSQGDHNKSISGEEGEDAQGGSKKAQEKDPQSEMKDQDDDDMEEEDKSGVEEEKVEESGDDDEEMENARRKQAKLDQRREDEEKLGKLVKLEEQLEKFNDKLEKYAEKLEKRGEAASVAIDELHEDSERSVTEPDLDVTNASTASFITCQDVSFANASAKDDQDETDKANASLPISTNREEETMEKEETAEKNMDDEEPSEQNEEELETSLEMSYRENESAGKDTSMEEEEEASEAVVEEEEEAPEVVIEEEEEAPEVVIEEKEPENVEDDQPRPQSADQEQSAGLDDNEELEMEPTNDSEESRASGSSSQETIKVVEQLSIGQPTVKEVELADATEPDEAVDKQSASESDSSQQGSSIPLLTLPPKESKESTVSDKSEKCSSRWKETMRKDGNASSGVVTVDVRITSQDSDLPHDEEEQTEELDYEETPQHHHTPIHFKEEKKVKAEKVDRPSAVKKEHATERKTKRERSISPARYPVNQVLMIRQLIRPFTAKQLMELLETYGTVVDNGFWMDRIKSMCLAKFSTVEEAIVARGGLHNIKWPSHSPRTLKVDYSDDEGLVRHMASEEKPKTDTSTGSQPAGTSSLRVSVSLLNREQRSVQGSSTTKDKQRDGKRAHSPPNRESEAGSSEKHRREERHDHSKRGHSPSDRRVREPEKTPKKADELFKKTTTMPAIYYVALTEEQILERSKRKAAEAQMLAARRTALQNARREKGERGDKDKDKHDKDKDKPKSSTKKADEGPSTVRSRIRSRSPRNSKDSRNSKDTRNTHRGRSPQTVSSRHNRR